MASAQTFRLKTVLDNLDDVPEAAKSFYREGDGDFDGKFVLDVDEVDGFGLANNGKINGALSKERIASKAAQKERDDIRRKLEALTAEKAALEEQLSSGVPDAKALREQIAASLKKQHDSALASSQAEMKGLLEMEQRRRDSLVKQIERTQFDAQLNALAAGGKWKFPPKILSPHLRGRTRFDIDEETGEVRLVVLDANGEPKLNAGRPASLEDLVVEFTRDAEFGSLIARADSQPTDGSKPRPGGKPSHGSGPIVVTREQAKDTAFYRAQQKAAADQGREFVVLNNVQESSG